jgi:hypothetical protein
VDGPNAIDQFEAVHVRNYDHADGHSIHVTVTDAVGRVRLTSRCYLAPGQSRRMATAIEPGEYRLAVRVDGVARTMTECRLGEPPARTAVVELGNSIVSVSQGASEMITG